MCKALVMKLVLQLYRYREGLALLQAYMSRDSDSDIAHNAPLFTIFDLCTFVGLPILHG